MGRRWIKEKKRDYYYRKAKEEHYRSRAAYKLKQLNERFGLMRPGDRVLDLGAAPGGWMQVARELVGDKGLVVGVDLVDIEPLGFENALTIKGDLRQAETLAAVKKVSQSYDVVISDASPDISGVWSIDHLRSVELCEGALAIASEVLKPGSNMLFKVFQGEEVQQLFGKVAGMFSATKTTKPQASRGKSSEMYIVALGFSPV